jgi:hypothetical protein
MATDVSRIFPREFQKSDLTYYATCTFQTHNYLKLIYGILDVMKHVKSKEALNYLIANDNHVLMSCVS